MPSVFFWVPLVPLCEIRGKLCRRFQNQDVCPDWCALSPASDGFLRFPSGVTQLCWSPSSIVFKHRQELNLLAQSAADRRSDRMSCRSSSRLQTKPRRILRLCDSSPVCSRFLIFTSRAVLLLASMAAEHFVLSTYLYTCTPQTKLTCLSVVQVGNG